jgi:hypothetical protein
MKKLQISPDLSLPPDAATSTLVVYGGKGMGKTNFASVLVEEFASAGIRFAVIDPMGVWWGLRHSSDGRGRGIDVLILGGIHGDLPITPESGVLVADLVVDEDTSVIIDISRRADGSMWSIGERVRFVTAYTKRLYQRQGEKRRPINQVIDEAARFAPQIVRQGESEVAACMGAIAVLVEEGRNVGIGVVLVTQRSARLNKDVAELADCMIAFRIVGPNSMRAVLDWLGEHVEKARLKEIGEQLRSLPRGSALVISPGWLEFEGMVAVRKRTTFDSSKTPEAGKEVRAAGKGAAPDLAKYRERLATLVEHQKANDPKALKARVAELEKQLAAKPGAKVETKLVEKPVLKDGQLRRAESVIVAFEKLIARWDDVSANAHAALDEVRQKMGEAIKRAGVELGVVRDAIEKTKAPAPTNREVARQHCANDGKSTVQVGKHEIRVRPSNGHAQSSLPVGEQATLRALIQYPAGLARSQLTVLTGYKRSTRDAYIARLREKGFVDVNGDRVFSTQEGCDAMPDAEPLPTGPALQDWWLMRLPSGEGAILGELIKAYPGAIAKDDLTESTGFKRSTRDAYLSRLAAKELVVEPGRGEARASAALFEAT